MIGQDLQADEDHVRLEKAANLILSWSFLSRNFNFLVKFQLQHIWLLFLRKILLHSGNYVLFCSFFGGKMRAISTNQFNRSLQQTRCQTSHLLYKCNIVIKHETHTVETPLWSSALEPECCRC